MAVPSVAGRFNRWAVRGGLLALAAAAAGFIYVLATVPPGEDTFYPRCQLHAVTGLHCPGCGTTRALHALLNGRVVDALVFNAVFPVVIPFMLWAFVHSVRVSRANTSVVDGRAVRWGFRVVTVLVISYGVLRNLPWYPFTLLVPHEL